MAILYGMARTSIKATYSLDPETVRVLDQVSRRWGVSKSEALRRAIHAASDLPGEAVNEKLAALDRLQKSLGLTMESADAWIREIRAERRAWKPPRL
jgi:hypothetical protein